MKQDQANPTKDGQTNWDKRERAPWSVPPPATPAPKPMQGPSGLRQHQLGGSYV